MAELTPSALPAPDDPSARPFPPGDYPLVVVGSGPGALQVSYSLRQLGVPHAVISADPAPGGMFRRWPMFQRLLSWTKPYAPAAPATRLYERYDWNSLIPEGPENASLMPEFMDGTSYFPARAEMEQNLVAFATRTGIAVRYGCPWTGTRLEEAPDAPDGRRFVLETTHGDYRCATLVLAVGVAEPYVPSTPGLELAAHYAETRPAETYAGRRVFVAGKQNSGFELASGLLPWARQITLASPSPARLSVNTRSLVGVRARYVQPFEDHALGGGVSVIDASIERIERTGEGGFLVSLRATSDGASRVVEADDLIAATGFVAPLLDLPSLGVATVGASRLPVQTAWWESVSVPGIFFAGTLTQGAPGLKKHGIPSNSGAVHGARYNARLLAGHLARTRFGRTTSRRPISADGLADRLVEVAAGSPELWHQKAYLAWLAAGDPDGGFRDEGIVPLVDALDRDDREAVILTLEADGSGAIYPVVYVRRAGRIEERALDADPRLEFAGPAYRAAFDDLVRPVAAAASS